MGLPAMTEETTAAVGGPGYGMLWDAGATLCGTATIRKAAGTGVGRLRVLQHGRGPGAKAGTGGGDDAGRSAHTTPAQNVHVQKMMTTDVQAK